MKTVTYSAAPTRVLRKLPAGVRKRIVAKLRAYAATGVGDVNALAGTDLVRLRVGDYRVIVVGRIGHRRDVYR